MFQQNFHTDQNQNDAAGQGRLVLILRAELMPDAYACRGKHKGRAADQRDGSYDPHLQESERNADRQRVDTGRDREDEKLFDIQLLPAEALFGASSFFRTTSQIILPPIKVSKANAIQWSKLVI